MIGSYEEVLASLKDVSSVLVCTHVAPDADALGSAGALAYLLAKSGVDAKVAIGETVPEKLSPLLAKVQVVHEVPKSNVDVVIAVDTATEPRVSMPMAELRAISSKVVNVDHHISNTNWADVNLIVSEAAASAQIVFELLKRGGFRVCSTAANLLYMGLLDDTGSFRFSNASSDAFRCAAELVDCGAKPDAVAEQLYFSLPFRELQIRAHALTNLNILLDGRLAMLSVSSEMLREAGATAEDTEGVVDIARSVSGTKAAVFMRELSDGWKLSLRSKDAALDVQAIAAQFGGGGHTMAAGAKIVGSQAEVESKIVEAFKQAFTAAGL